MRLKWKKGKTRNTAEVVKRNEVAKESPVLVNNHHVYPRHRKPWGREAHDGHWLVFSMMTPTGTAPAGAKNVGRPGNQSLGTKDLDWQKPVHRRGRREREAAAH